MNRYPEYTRERLRQLGERLGQRIYAEVRPLASLEVAGPTGRIPFPAVEAITDWREAKLGDQFGPLWMTYWFRARAEVPAEWGGRRVDLLWISHSEATLWRGGQPVQGLNHDAISWEPVSRPDAVLTRSAAGGDVIPFHIEMACNRLFGQSTDNAGHLRHISPYVLDRAEIGLFDAEAWELHWDFHVLQNLEAEHARNLDPAWAGELLAGLNEFANLYRPDDRETWRRGAPILKDLLMRRNASSTHELSAIGHAHIDTAWLWPLDETRRKCARSFSTALAYMDEYPEYRFACSQAQQYVFMQESYPHLYERIQEKVRAGQWIVVGGTWIEPDCNLPSGESLVRQFLYGQRYFRAEFGSYCREFWNPDVFGYNGQLPQICRLAGIDRFLTQKLSWNRFNKPQHHTFIWEGIDGSEVLTHFPPLDTYNAQATVQQLRENAAKFKDNDRSGHSYMLFGIGDGGGGPTKEMLERILRAEDLQGLPRTKMRTSDEFFQLLEQDRDQLTRVVGELYLEYHRGTYTTQAEVKAANRRSEEGLRSVEFLYAAGHAFGAVGEYPRHELSRIWKLVLLNQFHDILPGSSIGLVYEDAARDYADAAAMLETLRQRNDAGVLDAAEVALGLPRDSACALNVLPFHRREVTDTPAGLAMLEASPCGLAVRVEPHDRVTLARGADGSITLANAHLRATLDAGGTLVSLVHLATGRESMAAPGNTFLLYDDRPTMFDAWDCDPYHMETETECGPASGASVLSESPLRAEVRFERAIGRASRLAQTVRLDSESRRLEFHTEIDWHEEQTMLKVAFPVTVRAMNATYEMQFGTVERPTHFNTTFDLARYEVPGHRWSDLSEHRFGVALLSDSKYGYSTYGNTMRLSLLRAPLDPDPQADRGSHRFAYALMPHDGGWREAGVIGEAACFNMRLFHRRETPVCAPPEVPEAWSLLWMDTPDLLIDTVKLAEDSDDLIVRLYECHGARGTARLRSRLPFASASACNILEDGDKPLAVEDGAVVLTFRPHEILTVRLARTR